MSVSVSNCVFTVGDTVEVFRGPSQIKQMFKVTFASSRHLTITLQELVELPQNNVVIKGKTKKPYYRMKERW